MEKNEHHTLDIFSPEVLGNRNVHVELGVVGNLLGNVGKLRSVHSHVRRVEVFHAEFTAVLMSSTDTIPEGLKSNC